VTDPREGQDVPELISDEMRGILGVPFETTTSFPIDPSDIRRWAIAVYYPEAPPPLYWDDEYAKTTPWGGIVAPEEFNPFAWMSRPSSTEDERAIDVDPGLVRAGASEHRLGVVPPSLLTGLNGGMEVDYTEVPMRPGDVITSTSAIVDYKEREGRLGHMLFTTTENTWRNQRGELVKTVRMTLIRY
jgi:hypothetical protein